MTLDPATATTNAGAAIERFIRAVGNVAGDDPEFSRDIDLFDAGYLDSLGLVALTTFLEDTYALPLTEEDLFNPAFTTINGIINLLHERTISRGAGR